MKITNDILNSVKSHSLKNIFPSDRNFIELFPADNFDFSGTKYTHFLYFDIEEAKAYLLDFMCFISKFYACEVFSYKNYFSIFDEFRQYLDSQNIFLYTTTRMGFNIANGNKDLLFNTLQKQFGEHLFLEEDDKVAFSNTLISDKPFNYEFFNYLLEKASSYNNYLFTVEPLMDVDIKNIRDFYSGHQYNGNKHFFINTEHSYWKHTKEVLLNTIISATPTKAYAISSNGQIIMLAIANVDGSACNLTLLCDSECYNSDLSYPLDFICDDLFAKYDISKISTINDNKGIAYSGINSILTISHFKPDYSLNSSFDGYSRIRYELTREANSETKQSIENSIIKFAL